jgi:hypothetical protein
MRTKRSKVFEGLFSGSIIWSGDRRGRCTVRNIRRRWLRGPGGIPGSVSRSSRYADMEVSSPVSSNIREVDAVVFFFFLYS